MAPPQSARLLVVDDVPENRELLVRRLQRQGHGAIATAGDGIEALEMIRSAQADAAPFDAVLLDVMMPRMSGVEVLEALHADPALSATPVIMISAATELDTVVRCIELGAEDYLPKPFNPVLLRARLGSVLEIAWNANWPKPAASNSACCRTNSPRPIPPTRSRSTP
jgi:CheY-like chemotaxis protein